MTSPDRLSLMRRCASSRGGRLLLATLLVIVGGVIEQAPGNAAWADGALNRPTIQGPFTPQQYRAHRMALDRQFAVLVAKARREFAVAIPVGPTNLKVKGPVLMAPGDSLTYTLTWGAASRATGYKVTLASSLTNGTWTATGFTTTAVPLPASVGPATGLSFTFTAISTTADSAALTACVESADVIGLTGKTACVTWKVKRRAGAPGPIIVDSSRMNQPVGTLVLPNPIALTVGASQDVCAFKVFTTGAVAMWTQDSTKCRPIYQAYVPVAMRVVTPAQQAHTDSTGVTCVTWMSSMVAVAILPNGTCSAAARTTGIGLTLRLPTGMRYASSSGPAVTVEPVTVSNAKGDAVTTKLACVHPGSSIVTATSGGASQSYLVNCWSHDANAFAYQAPSPLVLAALERRAIASEWMGVPITVLWTGRD